MKKLLLLSLALMLSMISVSAAKTVYIPDSWVYNSSTQEYTEGGNSDLQWSFNRSKQSDNCIVFWQKGFGSNPKTANPSFDPDAVLNVAEQCYAMNVNTLGFSCSNMLNKYKILILVSYTNDWVCYGGGYDFECSALWIGPSAVNPAGHALAHEVGHSFHYMAYAEAANYNHVSSETINTGFHLGNGKGQSVWEQTAQWQANQVFPEYMFSESYPLFGNNANYAFSHEWMRYQSYWFLYYLCQYYNDITTVAQVWKTPMTGQSEGNATDFCQAFIQLKNLTAAQFYERYFDYALHCATFDFNAAVNYRNDYIGKFDYRAVQLAPNKYQVAYSSVPQSTGFNVIELNVPTSGTSVTTNLTALTHGCTLANSDPGQYNDGNANTLVSADVSNYNSAGNASYRGFRIGYVFLKSDGTREYYNDNIVHCTGTAEKTESITYTVPANTSRMFLVIAPSLTTYVKHAWDDNILNDDQWPYQFELVNASAKSVTPYFDEPEFTKQIDGREISDVTLTYNVTLPPTNGYDGATVNFSGSGLNALCTAFQMEGDNIFNTVIGYAANQANGTIMNYAVNASMELQSAATNTNGDFGHWFNASGIVANWGDNTVAFDEFNKSTKSVNVGQFPDANSNGTTRTIREAFVYKNSTGKTATAYFIFNITFDSNVTSGYSYLSDIHYVEPSSAETASATAYRAKIIQDIALSVMQGNSATSEAVNTTNWSSALNNLNQDYITNGFNDYVNPLSNTSTGNVYYYYALSAVPTTSTNGLKYYTVASTTSDTDFNGQYVHYYNASSGCVSSVDNAKLKVAYDKTNKVFTVKTTNDCPVGTYTVYMGMIRKVRSSGSNRYYVGYFPITVTVSEYMETDNWPDITSLPDDYSKWFFIFKDYKRNLYLTMRDGVHQAGDSDWTPKTMWYSSLDADKPEVNKNSLWTLDYYELDGVGYQLITNAEYRNYMLQNEWQGPWYWRTHDNGGGAYGWGRASISFDDVKATVKNGQYAAEADYFLGPWDNEFVDGAEVAFHKQNETVGYFNISQILRGEYVATYENLTNVDYDHPLDITYCLENEGGERLTTIGWKFEGEAWDVQTNNSLVGKQGAYYFQRYNASGIGNADMYQTVYGLPAGYYRFSAVMNGRENQQLYANNETAQATIGSNGESVSVVVLVNNGDILRVGAKAVNSSASWIAFDQAKLEYLGTSLPSANVGTPTPSIADGAYVQQLNTINFAFNEAVSPIGTFEILNNSASVTLTKDGTAVAQATLSINGTNLTTSFNTVALEPDATYTITLPAGIVGYDGMAQNQDFSLTIHTPAIFDGTYYFLNTCSHQYISRGGEWATAAVMDNWGLALILSTDINGLTSLKYFDNQLYLYNDGFCFGDGDENSRLKFSMEKVSGGYKFLNSHNDRYLAEWANRAVGDAKEGDNLWETSNIWTLESTSDHVVNYTTCADSQASNAATAASLTGITTKAALDSKVEADFYAEELTITGAKAERYERYAAIAQENTPSEYYKETLDNLTPGLYRLSVDAFQRAAWYDDVYHADGARGCIYLYANDAKTQIKSVMEYGAFAAYASDVEYNGYHYPNNEASGYAALETGNYKNVVYVYVPANDGQTTGSITFGINNPNRLGNNVQRGTWAVFDNFKLEYLDPYYILDETASTLPTAATGVSVKFLRTIVPKSNGGSDHAWNTICFPFSLSSSQIESLFGSTAVVKELTDVVSVGGNASLRFTQVESIVANKPYILQVDAGSDTYVIEDIDIEPSSSLMVEVGGVQFVGNYVCPKVMDNAGGTDYYILNDVFKSSTGRTKIKGYRAYFHIPEGSAVKSLGFVDDSTGILTLEEVSAQFPSDIYSVGGQLLRKDATGMDDLPRGIYIVNGKKMLKK